MKEKKVIKEDIEFLESIIKKKEEQKNLPQNIQNANIENLKHELERLKRELRGEK